MWKILTLLTLLTFFVSNAQVIPDFLDHDNYQPYMSEVQKQQVIKQDHLKQNNHLKTSQELHPQLYKYVKKGTKADPANALS